MDYCLYWIIWLILLVTNLLRDGFIMLNLFKTQTLRLKLH